MEEGASVEEGAGMDNQRERTASQFSSPQRFSSFFQPLSLKKVISPRELLPHGERSSLSPSSSTATTRLSLPSLPSLSLLHLFVARGISLVRGISSTRRVKFEGHQSYIRIAALEIVSFAMTTSSCFKRREPHS